VAPPKLVEQERRGRHANPLEGETYTIRGNCDERGLQPVHPHPNNYSKTEKEVDCSPTRKGSGKRRVVSERGRNENGTDSETSPQVDIAFPNRKHHGEWVHRRGKNIKSKGT